MGLDMYLTANQYIWDHKEEGKALRKAVAKVLGDPTLDVKSVTIDVGYWRKANQIHNWFVQNVQSGDDDCQKYDVSLNQLDELKDLCSQVLSDNDKAPELLPVQAGFFFGCTQYDDTYFEDFEDTIKIIDKAHALDVTKWDISYQSSW